jgi:hypothetical protein
MKKQQKLTVKPLASASAAIFLIGGSYQNLDIHVILHLTNASLGNAKHFIGNFQLKVSNLIVNTNILHVSPVATMTVTTRQPWHFSILSLNNL